MPASTAERMTPSAVPWPAVASAPALQWVRMRRRPGPAPPPDAPETTVHRHVLGRIACASAGARRRARRRSSAQRIERRRMRSSAQARLTAVGRLRARCSKPAAMAARNSAGGLSHAAALRARRHRLRRSRWRARRAPPWCGWLRRRCRRVAAEVLNRGQQALVEHSSRPCASAACRRGMQPRSRARCRRRSAPARRWSWRTADRTSRRRARPRRGS